MTAEAEEAEGRGGNDGGFEAVDEVVDDDEGKEEVELVARLANCSKNRSSASFTFVSTELLLLLLPLPLPLSLSPLSVPPPR